MSHPHKSATHDEVFIHVHECVLGQPIVTQNAEGKTFIGGTVFFRKPKDAPFWDYSVALCSHKDNFSREIGRTVARRRFFLRKSNPTLHVKPTYVEAKRIFEEAAGA